jgi:DNA-binding NarL/FixJ family response regulator
MNSITVLLADDHAVVRDGLGYLLDAQPDIEVIGHASNGREAVQMAKQLHPDVVVMDITMPELNGIDATLEISQSCSSSQVIILSMHSTTEHIYRALQAGAHGFIVKESAGIEVVNAVRVVNAGHHYLSQKITDNLIGDYIKIARSSDAMGPLNSLSSREREVLQFVVEGKQSAEIAQTLAISIKTVETYRSRMMAKLGISDIPSLVKFAVQQGLTPLE